MNKLLRGMAAALYWGVTRSLARSHPPCPDCCGGEPPVDCGIFSDTFSGDLSAWDQVSGSWSIDSGELTTSSTNAAIIAQSTSPGGDTRVAAKITATTGLGRLILDYADANNYHFAEVKIGSSGTGYIRLYRRSGGSNTLLGEVTPTGDDCRPEMVSGAVYFACMHGSGMFQAGIGGGIVIGRLTTPHDGDRAGLGTGSTGGVAFDDFEFRLVGGACPACGGMISECCCAGNCAGSPDCGLPRTWQVDINGLTSGINCNCDALLGTYFCDWVGPVGAAPCVWQGPVPGNPCGYLTCEVQIFQAVNRFIRAILVGNLSTGIPPGAFFDATQSEPFNCGISRTINGNLGSSTYCATTGHTADITPLN